MKRTIGLVLFSILLLTVFSISAAGSCAGKEYYVSASVGLDNFPGTAEQPFRTINAAAQVAKAGDTVVISGGEYREWVKPAHSGLPGAPITYRAATGEKVIVKGSDLWSPTWIPSKYIIENGKTWETRLSGRQFEGANPFALTNLFVSDDWAYQVGGELLRGQIFLDGKPLRQLSSADDFMKLESDESAFWVEEDGLTIHLELAGDADPNEKTFELTTREQVFAPTLENINYITIDGLTMMHAGNGVPGPAAPKGLVGANGGIGWVVKNCEIAYANTLATDLNSPFGFLGKSGAGKGILKDNNIHDCDSVGLCGTIFTFKRILSAWMMKIGNGFNEIITKRRQIDYSWTEPHEVPQINKENVSIPISQVLLPRGNTYEEWETKETPTRIYHVAQNAPNASDENDGSENAPFLTINKAAEVLMPGETVIVHAGVYRERVNPIRGGEPGAMIWYRAAEGEEVVIKGSDEWSPTFSPSEYKRAKSPFVWQTPLTNDMFEDANVFALKNQRFDESWGYFDDGEYPRGQLFLNGDPLEPVSEYSDLFLTSNTNKNVFWVNDNATMLYVKLAGGKSPKGKTFEITTREQVFAPREKYLNYIGVSGFKMFHAANAVPIPWPQKGLLSTNAGNHWIIEDCEIGYANTIGIDMGGQWWYYGKGEQQGSNIVRRNIIHHFSVCGIAAWHNMENVNLLIEDNYLYECCTRHMDSHCENAAIKIHSPIDSLIRRNVTVNTHFGSSIWLDGETENTRVTQNVCLENHCCPWGQIFMEAYNGPYLVDNNIMSETYTCRYAAQAYTSASGLYCHNAGGVIGVNNLILNGDMKVRQKYCNSYAIRFSDNLEAGHGRNDRVYANVIGDYIYGIGLGDETSLSDKNIFLNPLDSYKMFNTGDETTVSFSQWQTAGRDLNSFSASVDYAINKKDLTIRVNSDADVLPAVEKEDAFLPGGIGSDGIGYDFFGNPRTAGKWIPGPFVSVPTDGTPVSIDPRCLA